MRCPSAARLVSFVASLILASPALAAPGLKLSWDQCSADGRVGNRSFACDTNDGEEVLFLSYEPPVAAPDVAAIEVTLHVQSSDGVLPEWWRIYGVGSCRLTALTQGTTGVPGSACVDPYQGVAAGGIAGFAPDPHGTPDWRILAIIAVPVDYVFSIATGTEYFAMRLILRHVKTVGSGACAGCSTPLCVGFGRAKIVDKLGQTALDMFAGGPNTGGDPTAVTWQGAYTRDYTVGPDMTIEYAYMTCDPDRSVPVRRSAWGAVKALYR